MKYLVKDLANSTIMGIYKLEYPNGKVYIGQSQNIYKRVMEHNQRAKKGIHGNNNIQLCEQAIQKYGAIIEVDILEEVNNLLELDKREAYWIQVYQSTDKNKGYNLTNGGDVSSKRGSKHPNASLTQEQIEEIIELLLYYPEYSYLDIAKKYQVYNDLIYRISSGISYRQDNLIYPLRKNDHSSQKKTQITDYFQNEAELIYLKEDLKYSWWLKMDNGDLYKKYNITRKLLYAINKGEIFKDIGNYTYPIRTTKIATNLTYEDILLILNELRTTSKSMTKIGEAFNLSRGTISQINNGQKYLIKGYQYPARQTK